MTPKSTNPLQFHPERDRSPAEAADPMAPVYRYGMKVEASDDRPSSMRRPGERSALEELLGWLTRSFAVLALLSSLALLCVGATPFLSLLPAHLTHAVDRIWALLQNVPLSAIPLLLAGASYITLQA